MAEPKPVSLSEVDASHGHEQSDVSISGIVKFAGGLVLLIVVAQVVVAIILGAITSQPAQEKLPEWTRKYRVILPTDIDKIPKPRLQVKEDVDLEKLQERNEALLREYSWKGKNNQVRIPIDKAMEILTDAKKAARYGVRWSNK